MVSITEVFSASAVEAELQILRYFEKGRVIYVSAALGLEKYGYPAPCDGDFGNDSFGGDQYHAADQSVFDLDVN